MGNACRVLPLVRLRAVALVADAAQALDDELAAELARAAAAVLRLVDAALSAHGRAHGYLTVTAAWLDRALLFGHYVVVGYSTCRGPVESWLTMLAHAAGDRERAGMHHHRALARTREMPAPLLTADLERRHAALLR